MAAILVSLVPGLLSLQPLPAVADVAESVAPVGFHGHLETPKQAFGSTKTLPTLVSSEITKAVDRSAKRDPKRPKGALPSDEPHELTDSSIKGLKTPPPLHEQSEWEPAASPTGNVPAAVPPAPNASPAAPLPRPAVARSGIKEQTRDAQVALTLAEPTVGGLSSSGQLASGLWTYSTLTPAFSANVTDPE
ncbi:hypothetical protein ACWEPL_53325, partial [Nonomuraea sp. NPDC004186]